MARPLVCSSGGATPRLGRRKAIALAGSGIVAIGLVNRAAAAAPADIQLTVLRDTGDGRIYVVDVNPSAWGPPRPLPTVDAVRAVRAYAAALARLPERAVAADEGHAHPLV